MLKSVDVFNVFWNIEGFRNVVMSSGNYLWIILRCTENEIREALTVKDVRIAKNVDIFNVFKNIEYLKNVVIYSFGCTYLVE